MIIFNRSSRYFLVILTILISVQFGMAQYTTVGPVTFASNTYGPMVSRTDSNSAYSRHAYVYPAASLGSIAHGDSIRMLEFFKTNAAVYTGNPYFKMYLAMSDSADYGIGNIKSWSAEIAKSGVQKVFDGNIQSIVDASAGYKAFHFDSLFVFDTTQGSHLKIYVEFYQFSKQVGGQIPFWAYENDQSVTAFVSNNETKYVFGINTPLDSTLYTQVRKPSIRIHYPRYDKNAAVNNVYCLGELALLMAPIDTIKFNVRNTGKQALYNHPFLISITGANSFKDTVYVDTLDVFSSTMLFSSKYKPKNKGVDSITVTSIGDPYAVDDTTLVLRRISYNVLSHNNPFVTNAGFGIGFNGSSGDFIAKYYTDSNYINQIKIGFSSSGLPFILGIWQEDADGSPGTEVYTSDTLISNGGQYIQPILPKVQVHDGYFVGIRQLGTQNIAFLYEPETPVRPNSFYFTAPAGDTNWTPFDPGFDFNFDIQPRIQVAHDVAVLRMANPVALDTFEFNINDSIFPKATIFNYGVNDQNNPFDVVCEVIDQFDNVVYRSIEVITLDAEDSTVVTFSKKFSLGNYGDLRMQVYTKLSGDQASENDTISVNFSIYVQYDIQVESFFEPISGTRYELNKDKVSPTVRMVNFGSKDQTGIWVTSRIIQDGQIAKSQSVTIDLMGSGSQILAFDSVTIPFAGEVYFEVFCWNAIDSFPINDTARVMVTVVRSNDLGIVSVIRPRDSTIFERKQVFRPYLNYRNFGLGDQDSVVVTCAISQESGNVIYSDTIIKALPKLSTIQALFKEFNAPDSAQTLYFDAKTWIDGDQDTTNDTVRTKFFIKTKTDLAITTIKHPVKDSLYLLGDTIKPTIQVQNVGNNVVPTSALLYFEVFNSSQSKVYKDSLTLSNALAIDATAWLTFKPFTAFLIKDSYNAICYVSLVTDGERSNDTLRTNFNASLSNSVAILALHKPTTNEMYQLNRDTVFPSFTITNTGINDISKPVYYTLSFKTNATEVYTVSDSITTLASESSVTVNPARYIPLTTGNYTADLSIQNADDELLSDNTVSRVFHVSLQNDVSPLQYICPEIDSLVFANRTYAPKGAFKNLGDSSQANAFSVSFLIEFAGVNRYNSNKNITLDSGEFRTIVFDSTFKPTVPGLYKMMLISRLGTDQVTNNDTLLGSFVVDFHSSIERFEKIGLTIYPNPASDWIQVSSINGSLTTVELYDAAGKLVLEQQAEPSLNTKVDIKSLRPGYYWMKFGVGTESLWKKIVIK